MWKPIKAFLLLKLPTWSRKWSNKMSAIAMQQMADKVKPMLSDVYLFLDDIRHPYDAFTYTQETMFLQKKWVVVKNYKEFVKHIENNGLPKFISFDHDLADTHYTPQHLWEDYEKSKEWQESQIHKEKTGYECAKWLVDYCLDNNTELPEYYCHSQNPVGKDNILGLFKSFQNIR